MKKEKKSVLKKFLGKKWLVGIVVVIIMITCWQGYSYIKSRNSIEESSEVKRGSVSEELILTGTVKADEHAKLVFPTSGKLAWIGVKEGEEVKKGQALASLDRTSLNAVYQQALSGVRKYEATVDSVHDSLKNKDSTETFSEKDTRTTAEVAKDSAYDSLRIAEYNLKNANLYAPFAGIISFVAHPFSGVNVSLTETQIELVNPETIYFEVSADQSDVTEIMMGQEVVVLFDSFPDKKIKGKVSFVSYTPMQNELGSVYEVKVTLDEIPEKVKIGMTGDAKFILETKDNILFVDNDFVNTDKKGKYIFINNKKNKVYIEVGIENETEIEISGDIKEGDTVVN